jgi:hypothetical protein
MKMTYAVYVGKMHKMMNDFEKLMQTIMSEGLAIIDNLTPEELDKLDAQSTND